jgi:hypothetical protein
VGLTPASLANLAWVHIRNLRTFCTRSPMSGMLAPRLYLPVKAYHKLYQNPVLTVYIQKNL